MSSDESDQFAAAYPWISIGFFERILRREHQDDTIAVKDYTLNAALGKGENFMSQLLRVRINYSSTKNPSADHISLIVKAVISSNAEMAAIATEMGMFRREIIIFQKIMPKVEKLLHSIGDYSRISAKCYEANLELSYLVFEDLVTSGYANVSKNIGLDMDHFKHLLTKTAKWHAATAILINENPSIVQEFQTTASISNFVRNMSETIVFTLSEAVTQLKGFEHLAEKMSNLTDKIFGKRSAAFERKDDEFNALTHGDLWSNNIMFRYDASHGVVDDAILVDFQLSYWGPVILDVVKTLFSSSADALRANDWNNCVLHYHNELVRCLTALKYPKPIPSLNELQVQQKRCGDSTAVTTITGLVVRNMVDTDDSSLKILLLRSEENDRKRLELVMRPKIRSTLEFNIRYLNENGHLD